MSLTPENDLTGATLNAGWEVSKAILKGFVGIEKSESEEPSYYDLAYEALNKEDYEQALEYAKEGQEEFSKFEYYRLCGLCHYCMRQDLLEQYGEKADLLGLEEDTDDEDPRWRKIQSILDEAEKERKTAYNLLRQCIKSKDSEIEENFKDILASVYSILADVCDTYRERRRYNIAEMISDDLREEATSDYEEATNQLIDNFDNGEESFSSIDYHERQFIYIAKDIDALAGCYDESIPWLFTIKQLPKELQFPVGHPQPNSLYYAHPARRGYYMPIEGADEKLFIDKVQDFYRLAQGLGATEISFRLVKGRANTEAILSRMDIEVGGDYKDIGGNMNYGRKRSQSSKSTQQSERQQVERFNPTTGPYIPEDVHWLSVDEEWQRLVKMRMEGNMLHHSVHISSKTTMDVSESRMDTVKAAFKYFVTNANVSFSRQMEKSFSREEEMEYEISVTFKPLEELESNDNKAIDYATSQPNENEFYFKIEDVFYIEGRGVIVTGRVEGENIHVGDNVEIRSNNRCLKAQVTGVEMFRKIFDEAEPGDNCGLLLKGNGVNQDSLEKGMEIFKANTNISTSLIDNEQQYLDAVKECLEDGAEITPRDRRMLERIRTSLGISEKRAKELEASLAPQLTDEEMEYLETYREYVEEGEIGEKERRKLDRFAGLLKISADRVKEIERMA